MLNPFSTWVKVERYALRAGNPGRRLLDSGIQFPENPGPIIFTFNATFDIEKFYGP